MRSTGHPSLFVKIMIMTIGLCAISISSVLIKLAHAPAIIVAAYRLSFAAVFYLTWQAVVSGNPVTKLGRKPLCWAIGSGLFLSLHFMAWISSLQYTSVASSVVLVQTAPVMVAIGSYLFLQEKSSWLIIPGIALSLLGSALIGYSDFRGSQGSLAGNLLAMVGAFGAAGYLLFGRKLRNSMNTVQYVALVYTAAALATLVVVLIRRQPVFGYSANTYLLFFLIALFPQVVGHTTLNWALKHFSATSVSIMTLAEPIGASLLAFVVLQEQIGWMKFFSGLVILTGIAVVLWSEKKTEVTDEKERALDDRASR
jgi:drug/metabolite transporter (DMT)-like permease